MTMGEKEGTEVVFVFVFVLRDGGGEDDPRGGDSDCDGSGGKVAHSWPCTNVCFT